MNHVFSKEDPYNKIIFFDENGSSNALQFIKKAIATGETIDENRRYFTLTACVFEKDNYFLAAKSIRKLVKKFWGSPDEPIIFHTREIQKKVGSFNFGNDEKYQEFLASLSKTIKYMNFEIISITFDLISYVKQYYQYDPYQVAFDIILGTAMFNIKEDEQVAIVFETRGKKEDERLNAHISKTINKYGTQKIPANELQKHLKDIYFNPKISDDRKIVYHGIDIADLCSYPIYRYMRFGTIGQDFRIIINKLAGYKKFKEKDMRMPGLRRFPARWQK